MRFTWDPIKAASNLATHGVQFEAIGEFHWETALIRADVRVTYSEPRMKALGLIGDRVHVAIYAIEPRQQAPRLIGLRKAKQKEIDEYEGNS